MGTPASSSALVPVPAAALVPAAAEGPGSASISRRSSRASSAARRPSKRTVPHTRDVHCQAGPFYGEACPPLNPWEDKWKLAIVPYSAGGGAAAPVQNTNASSLTP